MGNVKRNKREDFQGEAWKDCPSFPGYRASNMGWVEYPSGHRTLGGQHRAKGYLFSGPSPKQRCAKAIHIIIADAFLPKEEGRIYINHKDRDRHNNKLSNLERVTPSENSLHAWNTAKKGFKLIKDLP